MSPERPVGLAPRLIRVGRACRDALPGYMVPARIDWRSDPLPRNANGKIDRRALAGERVGLFEQAA